MKYHLSALPAEIRAAVLKCRNQIETSQGLITLPKKKQVNPRARFFMALLGKCYYCPAGPGRRTGQGRIADA